MQLTAPGNLPNPKNLGPGNLIKYWVTCDVPASHVGGEGAGGRVQIFLKISE